MPSGRFINLRAKPFQEAHLILDVLGEKGEKLTLRAQNARKSRKRFGGGVLEPLNFSELHYTQAKSGHLYVKEARIIYPFTRLRQDYNKLELSFYFLKLIAKGAHQAPPDNKALFNLLGTALRCLETTHHSLSLKLQFELKYLHSLGLLAPDTYTSEWLTQPLKQHSHLSLPQGPALKINQFIQDQFRQEGILAPKAHEESRWQHYESSP